jgi:hypothetical protein
MYILYLSQKMRNIYKLKLSESIPDEKENQFPLMNWYVKPEIINRKKYILFLALSLSFHKQQQCRCIFIIETKREDY